MIKTFSFIKRNRIRKKFKLYKYAFNLLFDLTLFTYIFLFLGYFIVAWFRNGSSLNTFDHELLQMEGFSSEHILFVVTILPLVFIVQSNNHPGVMFSSTERLLLKMPYKEQAIFILLACERWLKALIMYSVIGIFLSLFMSIPIQTVIFYVLFLLIVNILMTIPQWILFQYHFFIRFTILVIGVIINVINITITTSLISIIFLFSLLILQPFLYRTLFSKVDWQRTVAAGDFAIWNMIFISHITKVKYKRDKKTSLLQRFRFWRRPFKSEKAIYKRIWYIHFTKNIVVILQIIGTLLILQLVILYIKDSYFPAIIAITIYVYSSFLVVLFEDNFSTELFLKLPWELLSYKRMFLRWVLYISVLFLIPIFFYLSYQPIKWMVPLVVLYVGTFISVLNVKLNRSISHLEKDQYYTDDNVLLTFLFLIIICFSGIYPTLSLGSFYFIYIIIKGRMFAS